MKIENFRESLEEKLNVLNESIHNVRAKLLGYPPESKDEGQEEMAHDLSVPFKDFLHWAEDYTQELVKATACNYDFIVERNCEKEEVDKPPLGCDSLDLLDDIYDNILFIKSENLSILYKLASPIIESEDEEEYKGTSFDFKESINRFTDKIIYELDTTIEIIKEQYDFIVFAEPSENNIGDSKHEKNT